MARINIKYSVDDVLNDIEDMESKLNALDKVITTKLTSFVLKDIEPFIPVDVGLTRDSMYQYTLFAEGLIQWIRKHSTLGYDVVYFIHRHEPWIEKWIASGGLVRTEYQFSRLVEEYIQW